MVLLTYWWLNSIHLMHYAVVVVIACLAPLTGNWVTDPPSLTSKFNSHYYLGLAWVIPDSGQLLRQESRRKIFISPTESQTRASEISAMTGPKLIGSRERRMRSELQPRTTWQVAFRGARSRRQFCGFTLLWNLRLKKYSPNESQLFFFAWHLGRGELWWVSE